MVLLWLAYHATLTSRPVLRPPRVPYPHLLPPIPVVACTCLSPRIASRFTMSSVGCFVVPHSNDGEGSRMRQEFWIRNTGDSGEDERTRTGKIVRSFQWTPRRIPLFKLEKSLYDIYHFRVESAWMAYRYGGAPALVAGDASCKHSHRIAK